MLRTTPPATGESRRPAILGLLDRNEHDKAVLATSKAVNDGRANDLGTEVMTRVLEAGFNLPQKPEFAVHMRTIARTLAPVLNKRDRRGLKRMARRLGHTDVASALEASV
jgi:hypothetical protein